MEAKSQFPADYLLWTAQARNLAQAFALAYGRRYHKLGHLQACHEANPYKYPFTFVADAWEELIWRQTKEIRHAVAVILKDLGKEDVREEEFASAARSQWENGLCLGRALLH
eukprot:3640886-Heterocapsa_arctica.AAC.1